MKSQFETYRPNRAVFLLRSLLALLLILFVMAKPIRALVINSSGDKIELSKMDSDQQESEEKDSQEDSEEDSEEEEEKFNETFDLKSPQTVFTSNDNFNIQFIQDHSCDYKPGIVLPPPELT